MMMILEVVNPTLCKLICTLCVFVHMLSYGDSFNYFNWQMMYEITKLMILNCFSH